jgi:uncharacterized protein YecT (DUF1311 family)
MTLSVNHVLNWSVRVSLFLMASTAIAQGEPIKTTGDPNLRRHWAPEFDITLPKGVTSDDLKGRCWSQPALNTYVTQARFWIEDIYGLPYGYVDTHCLKEQLSKANTALNTSYATLLRSLGPAERRTVVAAERLWIVRRNRDCNVPDGVTYVMLGSFVCLMNMTTDRLQWVASRQSAADAKKKNAR